MFIYVLPNPQQCALVRRHLAGRCNGNLALVLVNLENLDKHSSELYGIVS